MPECRHDALDVAILPVSRVQPTTDKPRYGRQLHRPEPTDPPLPDDPGDPDGPDSPDEAPDPERLPGEPTPLPIGDPPPMHAPQSVR